MRSLVTRCVFCGCCILSLYLTAACSKSHLQGSLTLPPSGLHYSPDSSIVLPGAADTSITPVINWNGHQGSFTFAGPVSKGISIDKETGRVSWPGSLPIGNYSLPVIASN